MIYRGTTLHSAMNETPLTRKIILGFYVFLLIAGVTFYWTWSFLYGTWRDIGVYSISVVAAGFGLVGIMLYSIKPLEEEED